ncbi:MAG: hypothetical protein HYZ75_05130 [Elusimicrobia bacterium]|nr:hypothetical protein [Elusimicrobiota bacterium]
MRALALLLAFAAPAGAVMRGPHADTDARRFGLDQPQTAPAVAAPARLNGEIDAFNRSHRGRWNMRFGLQGVGPQGTTEARLTAKEAGELFLRERGLSLGLRPEQLRLAMARTQGGMHHLLFEQIVDGVPVELSSVKVHLDESGAVIGLNSSFKRNVRGSPVPVLGVAQAAASVAADLGAAPPAEGRLVWFPPPAGGSPALAWKFRSEAGGSWVYYIDARDGRVLLRYNDLRFQACVTSGTIRAMVHDIDPNRQTVQGVAESRPIKNQRVFIGDANNSVLTDANGQFCSAVNGKIFTQLQGPFVSISNWNGAAAHYDNGGGVWTTFSTPLQSDHPYAANATVISTINAPAGAVKVMPVFAAMDVGSFDLADGDLVITDNDQLAILDSAGNSVATYIGNRTGLRGAAVPGNQLRLRLKTNATGARNGFSISVSSYLTLTNNPFLANNQTATFTWNTTQTLDGTLDEPNLFYQLNLMHDYFRNGPNAGGEAPIDKVVPVMARAGPNLANAFYDPLHQNLTIGDVASGFALDATVVRHEYTHFVVDQIYPVINFGQHGAISEALADYFSASSLNLSTIGSFTGAQFGHGSLRELDCPTKAACTLFPTNWTGVIHEDSRMISQTLWSIRGDLMALPVPGAVNGKACADGLVFGAMFFYPDSFADFELAMKTMAERAAAAVPACGGAVDAGLIENRFSNHGINIAAGDQDVYEPNDGIASATDITTAAVVNGRIFPNADQDFYALGAAAGPMAITLSLPEVAGLPGVYTVYAMTLIDRTFNVVATKQPPIDINPTLSGNCPDSDCQTSAGQLVLNYDNPSANQFYLLVSAAPGDEGAITNTNSTRFYSLSAVYPRVGPAAAGIVSAQFDRDTIDFSVSVSTFVTGQAYQFTHARLRDHTQAPLSGTETNSVAPFLTLISSTSTQGRITGRVRLAPGFTARYPSAGTVHLEIFAVTPLGHSQSMGFSNAIALTASGTSLTAFNNLFNPARGEKATIKWETQASGRILLRLFTVAGQHVLTLLDEERPAGKGAIDWPGVNSIGQRVASGVYILHIDAPDLDETKKIVVVK